MAEKAQTKTFIYSSEKFEGDSEYFGWAAGLADGPVESLRPDNGGVTSPLRANYTSEGFFGADGSTRVTEEAGEGPSLGLTADEIHLLP